MALSGHRMVLGARHVMVTTRNSGMAPPAGRGPIRVKGRIRKTLVLQTSQGVLPSRGNLLFHEGRYHLCTWHSSHHNRYGLTPLQDKHGLTTLTQTLRTAKAMRAGGGLKEQRYARHGAPLQMQQQQHCCNRWKHSRASRCQGQEPPRLLHSKLHSTISLENRKKFWLEHQALARDAIHPSTTHLALTGKRMATKARTTGTQTGTGGWHREAQQQNLCDSGDKASPMCLEQAAHQLMG